MLARLLDVDFTKTERPLLFDHLSIFFHCELFITINNNIYIFKETYYFGWHTTTIREIGVLLCGSPLYGAAFELTSLSNSYLTDSSAN